jgi:hypothetical protein
MGSVLPVNSLIHEPQKCLIDKVRGLQRVSLAFPPEMPSRNALELAVNERHQGREGSLIALAPGAEKLCYFSFLFEINHV